MSIVGGGRERWSWGAACLVLIGVTACESRVAPPQVVTSAPSVLPTTQLISPTFAPSLAPSVAPVRISSSPLLADDDSEVPSSGGQSGPKYSAKNSEKTLQQYLDWWVYEPTYYFEPCPTGRLPFFTYSESKRPPNVDAERPYGLHEACDPANMQIRDDPSLKEYRMSGGIFLIGRYRSDPVDHTHDFPSKRVKFGGIDANITELYASPPNDADSSWQHGSSSNWRFIYWRGRVEGGEYEWKVTMDSSVYTTEQALAMGDTLQRG